MKTIIVPGPARDPSRAIDMSWKARQETMERVYRLVDTAPSASRVGDVAPRVPLRLCEQYRIAQHAPIRQARQAVCANAYRLAKQQATWPQCLNPDAALAYMAKAQEAFSASGRAGAEHVATLLGRYRELAATVDPDTGSQRLTLLRQLGSA